MSAVLTVTEHDPLHRTYVLDCQHATTTVEYLAPSVGTDALDERSTVLSILRSRHRQTCACAWVIDGERGAA